MVYSRFFEVENFHKFHKSMAVLENFTLEIFPFQTCGYSLLKSKSKAPYICSRDKLYSKL